MANLLTANQSGIETDASFWPSAGAGTPARDTTRARSGAASLRITSAGSGDTFCYSASRVAVPTSDRGKTYLLRAWAFTTLSGRSVNVGCDWYNGGTYVSSTTRAGDLALPANVWTEVTVTATVPATATEALLYLPWAKSSASGQQYWFDDMWFGTEDAPATITATLSGSLPALSGAVAGSVSTPGALSGSLPTLSGALAAGVTLGADLAGELPALAGGLSGTLAVSGGLSGALPTLSGTVAGSVVIPGALAGDLPTLSGVLAGGALSGADLAGELPALAGGLSGTLAVPGGLSGALPALSGVLAGSVSTSIRGIRVTVAGPGVFGPSIDGVGSSRSVDGVAVLVPVSGPSLVPLITTGPGADTPIIDGVGSSRNVDGVGSSRNVDGVGI